MTRGALSGTRVRESRLRAGLKQAELARNVGVSPAYLNLIEHNRRRAGPALLAALGRALGVDAAALAEGAEGPVLEGLREAAAAAGAPEPAAELERIEEFAGRFPGWAALLAARQARLVALERTVVALNERMAHDPFLSAALHEILSAVTAVRATAAILAESEDIDAEWRRRFHGNIHADSLRLTEAAAALVAWIDAAQDSGAGLASPQEEVEAWLGRFGYHLEALEGGAPEGGAAVAPEALIGQAPELASDAARVLARAHAARYREDALALPLAAMVAALAEEGPDPGRIARRFGVGLGVVLRRMASLPPDERTPVGLVICDGSGTLTFRKPVPGFALPRFGAACPLWPIYEALARPGTPLRAEVEMAGRVASRFVTYAWCETRHPGGFEGPAVVQATMLILPAGPALAAARARPVGSSCRICPRGACPARREPSIVMETT